MKYYRVCPTARIGSYSRCPGKVSRALHALKVGKLLQCPRPRNAAHIQQSHVWDYFDAPPSRLIERCGDALLQGTRRIPPHHPPPGGQCMSISSPRYAEGARKALSTEHRPHPCNVRDRWPSVMGLLRTGTAGTARRVRESEREVQWSKATLLRCRVLS